MIPVTRPSLVLTLDLLVVGLLVAACSSGGGSSREAARGNDATTGGAANHAQTDSGGSTTDSGGTSSASGGIVIDAPASAGGGTTNKPPAVIVETLPDGFTSGTTGGGFKVLGPLSEFEEPAQNSCANVLRAVVRDFNQTHVDFGQEKPSNWQAPGLYTNQILPQLPEDRKPVINPERAPLDLIEHFDDWYVNTDGVNVPYVMDVWLEPHPVKDGYYVLDVNNFFPLDDFNTWPEDVQVGGDGEGNGPHNFLFTTELHTAFEYQGGELFSFRGDDDVFVFINGQLAVDLGGIHGPVEGTVDLDARASELGIELGNVYTLDLFQAERNPGGSNFRIETSLDFKECGILPADVLLK